MMADEQGHDHAHGMAKGTLRTAFFLTAIILVVELAGGLLSHSLALLSDAGHVLTDIVALGLAWYATVQAARPADATNTYGYHRTGILAALANAVTLILIVIAIAYEAVRRFQHPETVTPTLMFVSAAVGIAVNLYIAFGLQKEGGENLNNRAALLHVLGDIGASIGVIGGSGVILLTRWYPADPLISLVIAVLIARGAWRILRETVDILMEATPKDLNVAQLVRDMVRQPGIADVHDLHVWSIAGGMSALSAHVQVADRPLSACDELLVGLNKLLQTTYKIGHSTIQIECAGCNPNHLYCTMDPEGRNEHDHAHHDHDRIADGLDVSATTVETKGQGRGVLGKRLLHTSQRACWPSPIHRAAPSTRAPVSVASEQTVGQLCNLSLPNTDVANSFITLESPRARTERGHAVRAGVRVEQLTIGWMTVEAIVAITAGLLARSVLLTAFGIDSVIELVTGGVLLWRLSTEARGGSLECVERAENRAAWVTGVGLVLLCLYIVASAGVGLWTHSRPENAPAGIVLALVALIGMPLLARRKRAIAARIDSAALRGDAACSLTCAYMAATLLVGLVLTAAFGWWWADSVAALGFLYWLQHEAREALEGARAGRGGCRCGDPGCEA